jgi:hypothetical protein
MGDEISSSGLKRLGRAHAEPLTGSSPRQIDFLHMRVPMVAHFAAIPSYSHKIAIDVDDSADSLFLLPEHMLSDFEAIWIGLYS